MFIKRLVDSDGRLAILQTGQGNLHEAGYFECALEMAIQRAGQLDGPNLTERLAVQRGFIEGYKEAIMDLLNFRERYVLPAREGRKNIAPDYGADEALVAGGFLTKEEADGLSNDRPKFPNK